MSTPRSGDFGTDALPQAAERAALSGQGLAGDWVRVRRLLDQAGVGDELPLRQRPVLPVKPDSAPVRPLELGHLELLLPSFRVARFALDALAGDGGLDTGSLDPEGGDWPCVEAALLRIREAYLLRFPRARGGFSLGDVDRLANLIIAVPGYQLARRFGRIPCGPLHPVLGSLLAVAERLQCTTQHLLFVAEDGATWPPDRAVSAAEMQVFIAGLEGPQASGPDGFGAESWTRRFLQVAIDGVATSRFTAIPQPRAVQRALGDLESAFDYALLGLQAFAVVGSLGPVLSRTHARMAGIVQDWRGPRTPTLERLQAWLEKAERLQEGHGFRGAGEWRASQEQAYSQIYAHCSVGLADPVRLSLQEQINGRLTDQHRHTEDTLRAVLECQGAFGPAGGDGGVEWLLDCLMHAFARTQQVMGLAWEIQQRINALLQREPPRRALVASDLYRGALQGGDAHRPPVLLEGLDELLGFRATITTGRIDITGLSSPKAS